MPKKSAGLLVYRIAEGELHLFLVHPGGPFWMNKDVGAWTIPKGETEAEENPLDAARREFREETGHSIDGAFLPLPECRQAGGKIILAWAVEAEIDADAIKSNSFELEWPPHSGKVQSFPEIDRGAWFSLAEARKRINKGQIALLNALVPILKR